MAENVPKMIAICYSDQPILTDSPLTFLTHPQRNMSIKEFLRQELLPRLQRKSFKFIVVRQLLSNGAHSSDLSTDILLSDLVDTKGLLTTLIILESDYEVKKQKKLGEQLSEMASQATKVTTMDTH